MCTLYHKIGSFVSFSHMISNSRLCFSIAHRLPMKNIMKHMELPIHTGYPNVSPHPTKSFQSDLSMTFHDRCKTQDIHDDFIPWRPKPILFGIDSHVFGDPHIETSWLSRLRTGGSSRAQSAAGTCGLRCLVAWRCQSWVDFEVAKILWKHSCTSL